MTPPLGSLASRAASIKLTEHLQAMTQCGRALSTSCFTRTSKRVSKTHEASDQHRGQAGSKQYASFQ